MNTTENNNNNIASSHTEHFRKLFRFGFHPTATRAVLLLRISSHISGRRAPTTNNFQRRSEPIIHNDYSLCDFTTEEILSFCIDTTRVFVVDAGDKFLFSAAPTWLVVDDHDETTTRRQKRKKLRLGGARGRGRGQGHVHNHFIFASMAYSRAIDWLKQSKIPENSTVSIDMYNTYSDERGPFDGLLQDNDLRIVELTLPSTVAATSIVEKFLSGVGIAYLDVSSLTNVRELADHFLQRCSRLTSVDLSGLSDVRMIGHDFLSGCSALTTLDLSPLRNVSRIGDGFLSHCSALTSMDLSPLSNLISIESYFFSGCSALTSFDLSPLSN
eukprot:PhM_4_TR8390/c1_g4_i3/m.62551